MLGCIYRSARREARHRCYALPADCRSSAGGPCSSRAAEYCRTYEKVGFHAFDELSWKRQEDVRKDTKA